MKYSHESRYGFTRNNLKFMFFVLRSLLEIPRCVCSQNDLIVCTINQYNKPNLRQSPGYQSAIIVLATIRA